jgi:hypothetical protein
VKVLTRKSISSFEMESVYEESFLIFHIDGTVSSKTISAKKEKKVLSLAKEIIESDKTVIAFFTADKVRELCGVAIPIIASE